MPKMSLQDASFLSLESELTPLHITMLMTFRLPKGTPRNYFGQLRAHLLQYPVGAAPFNYKLAPATSAARLPSWEIDDAVDLSYHLRRHRLPRPGGERELGTLVSKLHSERLDQARPLWELHLIEGLEVRRFALCLKIHHALADGMSLMHIIERMLAKTTRGKGRPPWAAVPANKALTVSGSKSKLDEWRPLFENMLQRTGKRDTRKAPPLPRGPRSMLNGSITGRRRFATQRLPLARVKALATAADATVNDVVLAICSGALRGYLEEHDKLPDLALVAGIPISLPRDESRASGNSVGGLVVSLSSDIADPRRRLEAIRESTHDAKTRNRLIPASINRTIAAIGNYLMSARPRDTSEAMADRTRILNLVISNVPGPAKPRYMYGAVLEGIYPASVLMLDQRLNITLLSCRGDLNFGLIGCPDRLPHLQRIAVLIPEAMQELEQAYGITATE